MHAYCLFCQTQKCRAIAREIELAHGVRCIYPRIVQRKWIKGRCTEETHDWLQGYVFIYSDEPLTLRRDIPGIIKLLGHGELKGENFNFAAMLLEHGGIMGTVKLVEVGDRCRIEDPMWKNLHGTVVKIDRGRKRCCIDIYFDDAHRTVWTGYDLVKPENELSGVAGSYE